MTVVRLDLAYDGTNFHGWARQPGVRTIQDALELGLHRMFEGSPRLSVAGRTDAGVHAAGQVASFSVPGRPDPARIQRALNAMLAPEVVVLSARCVADWFDARRSASAREYLYRINAGLVPNPFDARFVWHHPSSLALSRMRSAAQLLRGEHDFASFCRSPKLPAGTVRTLRRLSVRRRGDRLDIRAAADGFLHQMVRSLAGTLVAVGEGRIDPEAVPAILAARSRAAAGPVAPPHGLTLIRVHYGRRSG